MKRRERNYMVIKKNKRLFDYLHNDYIGRIEKAVFKPFYYQHDGSIVQSDSPTNGKTVTVTLLHLNYNT